MKKSLFVLGAILVLASCKNLQTASKNANNQPAKDTLIQNEQPQTPKLVVGIVVDQMRYDYLTRFKKHFGEGGFNRMMNEGFQFKNNHYNYVPTYTGPGHTSIFTGTTPRIHGIIANDWYDKSSSKMVYCAEDAQVKPLGTTADDGKMSPHRMKVTSFADQNRLHTQFRGKTIGVAIKDRGAILPAGHTANAAYWFLGGDAGNWISSDFYQSSLPQWVIDFNTSRKVDRYLKTWNTLKPIETYVESGSDINDYEHGFRGKAQAGFPYDLADLKAENGGYSILKSTPFGNDLTADFALAAVKGEQLGQDAIPDVLTLSFSSPDYIGHNFGVNSKEIQDNYLRLDRTLARFFNELDATVGKGNYTVFLTADHGAVHVPSFLKDQKIPAGYIDKDVLEEGLSNFIGKEYGIPSLIKNISNNQVFFDYDLIKEKNIDRRVLETHVAHYLLQQAHIDKTFTRTALTEKGTFVDGVAAFVQKGFNQKRSGDVVFVYDPSYISYPKKGSTHGSSFNYDTHAPLLMMGKGIRQGESYQRTTITDIAPTMSALLGITAPNGTTGNILFEAFQ